MKSSENWNNESVRDRERRELDANVEKRLQNLEARMNDLEPRVKTPKARKSPI